MRQINMQQYGKILKIGKVERFTVTTKPTAKECEWYDSTCGKKNYNIICIYIHTQIHIIKLWRYSQKPVKSTYLWRMIPNFLIGMDYVYYVI